MKSLNVIRALALSAFVLFAPSVAMAQSTGQELFEQGNALYNQKKYAEAVASYRRAIQIQPHSQPKAYLNCARAYTMLKDYPAANRYYQFYEEVSGEAADKKVKAEAKAAEKKAKNESYIRDNAQTTVLNQVQSSLSKNGPYLTRQGNGVLAYYDVLARAGYAEPDLYNIQQKIVKGMTTELELDVTPPAGQPLPNLDRTGWEFIRNKLAKLRQFADVQPDNQYLSAIESLAYAWEAFYRSDFDSAKSYFDTACAYKPALPAAYWGRLMLFFQLDQNDGILQRIDEAEKVYKEAGVTNTAQFFALLRAQAYRNQGNVEKSLEWLTIMQSKL